MNAYEIRAYTNSPQIIKVFVRAEAQDEARTKAAPEIARLAHGLVVAAVVVANERELSDTELLRNNPVV